MIRLVRLCAEHVIDHGGQSVETVPNAVDAAMFAQETDVGPYRREHQLEGKFVITYAGAHGVSNDLDVLIDCAHALRENSKICFVLVGDGKEKANLVQKAKSLELTNVRFQPPRAKEAMYEVLAAADVCVALLKPIDAFKTTYPNKVFDYMAAGKAILLAIDGVIREVVEEANCGIFVQPGDKAAMVEGILLLEQDRSSVIAMGKAGRRYVREKFDRAAQVEAMEVALNKIVDQSSRK
ncbi:MAG: glycosyltransferase family 4 protein [Chloroflexi bacterium]|nr:glycosyltransferase family 4 protein [Chloroflexota bacterium]